MKIPKFKSLEAERAFWDTHSITDFMDEFKLAQVEFARPKKKLISLRLETPQIITLKRIASSRGLGYLSMLRSWITERISKERRVSHAHN